MWQIATLEISAFAFSKILIILKGDSGFLPGCILIAAPVNTLVLAAAIRAFFSNLFIFSEHPISPIMPALMQVFFIPISISLVNLLVSSLTFKSLIFLGIKLAL